MMEDAAKSTAFETHKCAALDCQVDALANDLYGLTEAETALVEGLA
jgi:hypothetical protein